MKEDPLNPSYYGGDLVMRIIEEFSNDGAQGFLIGQVIKYVLRAGKKHGNPMSQDIGKAKWYLDRLLDNLSKSSPTSVDSSGDGSEVVVDNLHEISEQYFSGLNLQTDQLSESNVELREVEDVGILFSEVFL